jgi:hypothetical protein
MPAEMPEFLQEDSLNMMMEENPNFVVKNSACNNVIPATGSHGVSIINEG